jgi:hypothetical protein
MKRTFLAVVLACGFAVPLHADVTIKQTTSGKGLGISGKTTGTAYIKGNKMRSDAVMGDRTMSTIFDLDAQKMYAFDSRKKEVDVWDMAAFSAEMSKTVDVSQMSGEIKPNGQKKQFGSHTADGYDMEISVPAAMGGNKEMTMTITLSGPVWIVKNAPGSADYARFYLAAAEKGWIFGDPRAAKGQPGQAKAMAEMYRKFAEIGGIPFEMDMQMKMGGGGSGNPIGGLLARMGNITMTTVVEDVQTAAVSDDLFTPPAGYKLNNRK